MEITTKVLEYIFFEIVIKVYEKECHELGIDDIEKIKSPIKDSIKIDFLNKLVEKKYRYEVFPRKEFFEKTSLSYFFKKTHNNSNNESKVFGINAFVVSATKKFNIKSAIKINQNFVNSIFYERLFPKDEKTRKRKALAQHSFIKLSDVDVQKLLQIINSMRNKGKSIGLFDEIKIPKKGENENNILKQFENFIDTINEKSDENYYLNLKKEQKKKLEKTTVPKNTNTISRQNDAKTMFTFPDNLQEEQNSNLKSVFDFCISDSSTEGILGEGVKVGLFYILESNNEEIAVLYLLDTDDDGKAQTKPSKFIGNIIYTNHQCSIILCPKKTEKNHLSREIAFLSINNGNKDISTYGQKDIIIGTFAGTESKHNNVVGGYFALIPKEENQLPQPPNISDFMKIEEIPLRLLDKISTKRLTVDSTAERLNLRNINADERVILTQDFIKTGYWKIFVEVAPNEIQEHVMKIDKSLTIRWKSARDGELTGRISIVDQNYIIYLTMESTGQFNQKRKWHILIKADETQIENGKPLAACFIGVRKTNSFPNYGLTIFIPSTKDEYCNYNIQKDKKNTIKKDSPQFVEIKNKIYRTCDKIANIKKQPYSNQRLNGLAGDYLIFRVIPDTTKETTKSERLLELLHLDKNGEAEYKNTRKAKIKGEWNFLNIVEKMRLNLRLSTSEKEYYINNWSIFKIKPFKDNKDFYEGRGIMMVDSKRNIAPYASQVFLFPLYNQELRNFFKKRIPKTETEIDDKLKQKIKKVFGFDIENYKGRINNTIETGNRRNYSIKDRPYPKRLNLGRVFFLAARDLIRQNYYRLSENNHTNDKTESIITEILSYIKLAISHGFNDVEELDYIKKNLNKLVKLKAYLYFDEQNSLQLKYHLLKVGGLTVFGLKVLGANPKRSSPPHH